MMKIPRFFLATIILCHHATAAPAQTAPAKDTVTKPAPAPKPPWHDGYEITHFKIDGRKAQLVLPKSPAPGKPWIWRTEFVGHQPQGDLGLLEKGFHVAYIDMQNLYGGSAAMKAMTAYHAHVTQTFGLSQKAILEGFSRGGLFAFNWATQNPHHVAGLYVDAPVCDFKSWPGGKGTGKGSRGDWQRLLTVYDLTEEQALAYDKNPIDTLAPLVKAGIPILAVVGEADRTVPASENINVVEKRYKELGGVITIIRKPGVDHHPHSIKDPAPIVDFALHAVNQ